MYRDSSLALRMTVRVGNPVALTINCGASRHHNPLNPLNLLNLLNPHARKGVSRNNSQKSNI